MIQYQLKILVCHNKQLLTKRKQCHDGPRSDSYEKQQPQIKTKQLDCFSWKPYLSFTWVAMSLSEFVKYL